MADPRIHGLYRDLVGHRIDRRGFIKGATALGLSATSINLFMKSAAFAQAAAVPPIVAQPGSASAYGWAGKSITVQVIDASVKEPLIEVRPEFEAATGATVNIVADPIEGAFDKLIADATGGSPTYDGSGIAMSSLGELVEGDLVVSISDYEADTSGKFPDITQTIAEEPASLTVLRSYDGKAYVIPNDCDGQALYYRRDLLTDPAHQAAFKTAMGYDLPVPPVTWDQVYDIGTYFQGKPNGIDGSPLSGVALHLKVGGQGMYHYATLSAPYVLGPNNTNLYWFDPDTMKPLFESAGHQAAMEMIIKLFKLGPSEASGWALGDAWAYFLKGNAVFTYSWGDVTPLAIEQKQPTVGKLGCSQCPGTLSYTNPKTGEENKVDTPNIVGNTTGGSWSGVVMKSAKDPDLVYYFWALMSTVPKQTFYGARGSDGVDPARKYQTLPPNGTAKPEDYTSQGWDINDATEYTTAFFNNFSNPLQLPYLRIPGASRYWSAMDIRLSEAVTGQTDAATALKNMAADMEAATDELGRDAQIASYKKSLGL